MRTWRRVIFVFLFFVASPWGWADDWESLRHRAGNDDVFVVFDVSQAMAGAPLSTGKALVQELFSGYLKEGDRVIVMTFDSVARVHGSVRIEQRRRDLELLRDVVGGIETGRVIRYRGTWPDLIEAAGGPLQGGAAFADYCEMWRLSGRLLQAYGEPSRRQFFLLITNGQSAIPLYRPCADPRPSTAILSELRQSRLRAGMILLTGEGSPAHARDVIRRISPAGRNGESWRVIELPSAPNRTNADRVLDVFNARIDLITPEAIDVTVRAGEDIQVPLTLVNRSPAPRRVVIRAATAHVDDRAMPFRLKVTPSTATLPPRASATVTLSSSGAFREPGEYRGGIVFDFDDAGRFDPSVIPLRVRRQSLFHEYRDGAAVALLLSGVGLTVLIHKCIAAKTAGGEPWLRSWLRKGLRR